MSALHFLKSSDYHIGTNREGDKVLAHRIKGYSVILFYSNLESVSSQIKTIFMQLAGSIGGCIFGVTNIQHAANCQRMSTKTITPIDSVPIIMFYSDGIPHVKYNSSKISAQYLTTFAVGVANHLERQKSNNKSDGHQRKIPAYSIGVPKCNNGICYMEFEEAYRK